MNSANDLVSNNQSRCENTYFECNENSFDATTILFSENFETITNEAKLEPLGWLNINTTGDEKIWEDKKITNIDNRVMNISAFNTGLQPLNAWLITPEVNINETTGAFIQFRLRTVFNNGNALKVWITNDYQDSFETVNWLLLDIDFPTSSSNYITVKQDISCLTGNIRLAFEYTGYDSVITSTYHIDDIIIYKENDIVK